MISKGILAAVVIVAILVIGGGVYMTQQPPTLTSTLTQTTPKPAATTPTQTPTTQETPTSTPSPTPTKTPEETLPGPILPMGTDEEQVEALVLTYVDAFDRNSAEEVAACFTEDATFSGEHEKLEACIGREEIKEGFIKFFAQYRGVQHLRLKISRLDVTEDRANVILHYEAPPAHNIKKEELLTIVKIDDTWRISKVMVGHGH